MQNIDNEKDNAQSEPVKVINDTNPDNPSGFGNATKIIILAIIFIVACVLMTAALTSGRDQELKKAIAETDAKRAEFERTIEQSASASQKLNEREQAVAIREHELDDRQVTLEKAEAELAQKQATLDEDMTSFNIERDSFYLHYGRVKELTGSLVAELGEIFPDEILEWIDLDVEDNNEPETAPEEEAPAEESDDETPIEPLSSTVEEFVSE